MFNGIYREHKVLVVSIFFISFILCCVGMFLLFYFDALKLQSLIEFMKSFVSNIITFISIAFGFYLTSISILFSSKYIKTLNEEDKKQPVQRQIHTLKAYFTLSVYSALLTISLSLIVLFGNVFENKYISIISFSLLISFFIENFIFIYLLLKVFMNALIIQARPNER